MIKKLLVIMPVYNAEKYLDEAILSVLNQTYEHLHLAIIDDVSTDGSYDIAMKYYHHDNVMVFRNVENRGCYYTRNVGLSVFDTGSWDVFTTHDPDDVSDPERVSIIMEDFINGSADIVLPSHINVDDELNPILKENGEYDIYNKGEGIAFVNRRLFNTLGYYDNTRTAGDTEYILRALAYQSMYSDIKISYNTMPWLYRHRIHGDNLTVQQPSNTRVKYYNDSINHIYNVMIPNNNFHRDKFE